MRSGIGYDIHRIIPTVKKSSIPLGGVTIPCFLRVEAHSDGDVLLHAIVDACLGALALGDIGQWFPDSKAENQNRASQEFVQEVLKQVQRMGWSVGNVDCIVQLEEPKLAEHSDAIRKSIATLLQTELSQISVKAKTLEGLGPVGEGRAIAAYAVVTLIEK